MARRIFRDGFVLALCIAFQAGAAYGLTTETVDDFTAWSTFIPYGDVTFTAEGSSLSVAAGGPATASLPTFFGFPFGSAGGAATASMGYLRLNPLSSTDTLSDPSAVSTNGTGLFGTLRVLSAAGDVGVGLGVLIGANETNRVAAYIYLDQYQGNRSVRYLLLEEDETTTVTSQLSAGVLGSWNTGWASDTDVFVAIFWYQGDIYFYADGFKVIPTLIPLEFRADVPPEVSVFSNTDGPGSTIRTRVTGLSLVRP